MEEPVTQTNMKCPCGWHGEPDIRTTVIERTEDNKIILTTPYCKECGEEIKENLTTSK